MKEKILIVEDQFVEADFLRLMLTQAGYRVTGIARSVFKAQEMIRLDRPGFVLLDIFLTGKLTGIDLAKQLREENIPFVFLSANSHEEVLNQAKATHPYGFLIKPFREKDLLVTLEIARYRHEHDQQTILKREAGLKDQLAEIIRDSDSWGQKLLRLGKVFQSYVSFDFLEAGFTTVSDEFLTAMGLFRIGYEEYQQIGIKELSSISGLPTEKLSSVITASRSDPAKAGVFNDEEFETLCINHPLIKLFADTFHLKSLVFFPLNITTGRVFNLCFYSRRADAYSSGQLELLGRLESSLTNSLESISKKANNNREKNFPYVQQQGYQNPPTLIAFEGIIGKSHLLLNVLDQISQVATSNTSVLILGESGTGKEKIADCIHNLSRRKGRPFVKLNCAALPATLIESELFGHEKGAFTGATEKRIGKFEKADKGTIFLDEIGEMPIELQVKLLRVLQEKEIERIGGTDTLKIDVRVIAATNKNLEKEVAEGRFRLDLYYRLNVFPILLPPLRERKEDIPALVYYFIDHYNHKSGKRISGISETALKNMMDHEWPGNIRQLEHIIERAVLLARGATIDEIALPDQGKKEMIYQAEDARMKTIHENERDHIVSVLRKCNGRIWGPGAAAEILNLPPSTLKSKMKKLGIRKEYIQ